MGSEKRGLVERLFGNAYLLLVLTTMAWGGNAVASRFAVGAVSPMALTAMRWLGVVILLALFARREIREAWPQLRPRLGTLALLGACGFTGFNALYYVAAHSTTAINIGILQGAIPIFVLLGAYLLDRAPVTALQSFGVLLTLIGVAVVTSGGSLARLATLSLNQGDLIMLGACALYAGYTLGLRRRPAVSALASFSVLALSACLAALPLAAIEAAAGSFQWPSPRGWLVLAYVVLFPSFLSQLSFMQGVKLIGPARAGVFVNLVPIWAALFSVLLLGEDFALYHGAALVLVLGGIWIAEHAKKRQVDRAVR
ncbi:Permease of the drug/metabolite transporter (DMT) superfamily [Tistlia consotensis]|uniref:Permease of the drug/metabolite transporter (DMT) superfamily n=1 Tax=Tistlia consotensis USBA 355 TaxID=560819 RepID=A0A1Y6CRF9_9PROT|nr:DMT family transporter [Tistlia consotensis]SMF71824.1 Permease of the drug/metabolite transporter (DMT) superfamily [Tistlia consotensis USBA 355]SNS06175.1 Permease of the drug/metabolite transporter (DMT) superfamily [Tistlia consotensis]